MSTSTRTIPTSHGDIAIRESSGTGLPILLLHGNSASKEVFGAQMQGFLGSAYRMIAIDLPGHGESSDAADPARSYSIPAYADMAAEVLAALGVRRFVAVGWSLGGHVAMEMMPRMPGMVGAMAMAAPPVGQTPEAIAGGFANNPLVLLAGKQDLTTDEVEAYGQLISDGRLTASLRNAIRRTDGRARAMMFANLFSGGTDDQRKIAETSPIPLAIVNGTNDGLVNVDYIDTVGYRNLWERHCHRLAGLGHAAFMNAPEMFNPLLARFLAAMTARATNTGPEPMLKLAV